MFTFKTSRSFFSRYFGFNCFSAKLLNKSQLKFWNIISGLSILFCSFPCLAGAIVIIYFDIDKSQIFVSSIDLLIVSTFMAIFGILETIKSDNFFHEDDIYFN